MAENELPVLQEEKSPWKSKTIWVAIVVAILPLFPSVSMIVSSNPELVSIVLGGIFSALRVISKDKVIIK